MAWPLDPPDVPLPGRCPGCLLTDATTVLETSISSQPLSPALAVRNFDFCPLVGVE